MPSGTTPRPSPAAHAPESAPGPPPRHAPADNAGHALRRIGALLLVVAVLMLGAAYLTTLITRPSDGTAVLGTPPFSTNGAGISVVVLDHTQTGLHSGDVVVAIDGRDVAFWTGALFQPGVDQATWHDGDQLTYTVLRHDRPLSVPVVLGTYPLGTVLGLDWGMLAFALTFEIVAAYVFVRRPADRLSMPLLLCASSLLTATLGYLPNGITSVLTGGVFWLFVTTALGVHLLFAASLLHAALLFPRPHPLLTGRHWIVPLVYGLPALGFLLFLPTAHLGANSLVWIALVYGSLIAILAAVYFAVVVGADTFLRAMTGGAREQPLVIVLSTLLTAALFQPLRRRLQRTIDRRFYRSKYDAAKTLAAFGASLRGDAELSQLAAHLVEVVDEAMKPAAISLWLNQRGSLPVTSPAAVVGQDEVPTAAAQEPRT